jgi:hypothetical protein
VDSSTPVSNASLWAGRIISALMVLFLLFDGVIHLLGIAPVVKAFAELAQRLASFAGAVCVIASHRIGTYS